MKRIFLPDVNFWIALAFDHHLHHPAALGWVNGSSYDALAFCRMAQQGLLRLATNRTVLTMAQAWAMNDEIVSDPSVLVVPEPAGIEPHWRRLTRAKQPSTHLWNDAFLAAFAIAGDFEIVTFDRGFKQFGLSRCTILP
jgi:toxin-antitoxin system PIN domain toxin